MKSEEETWPKTCPGCKVTFSEDDWENMPYVGIQTGTDEIPDVELRECGQCGTRMGILVPRDFVELS